MQDLINVHEIQQKPGNRRVGEYMRGFFNGLEMARAIFEDREPQYDDQPVEQTVHVVMGNDFPEAVFYSQASADEFVAAKKLEQERAERRDAEAAGRSYAGPSRVYWRSYPFVLSTGDKVAVGQQSGQVRTDRAYLGLATTLHLVNELKARIEMNHAHPQYTSVGGVPDAKGNSAS